MFIENKYTTWYNNIINSAKVRKVPNGYVEYHHIIPRSIGGLDNPDNLVALTAREHFICHCLLVRMVSDVEYRRKMIYAAWQLSRSPSKKGLVITGRVYEQLKQQLSILYTGRKRKPFSEETKANMRASAKTRKKVEMTDKRLSNIREAAARRRGIPLSDSHKQKISESIRGREFTDSHKQNIRDSKTGVKRAEFSESWRRNLSESAKGRIVSDATSKKLSDSLKGKNTGKPGSRTGIPMSEESTRKSSETKRNAPLKTCTHCGRVGRGGNMIRYHFDNCKSLSLDI